MLEYDLKFAKAARDTALILGKHRDFPISVANSNGSSFDISTALVYGDQVVEVITATLNPELLIRRISTDDCMFRMDSQGELVEVNGEFVHLYKHIAQVNKRAWQSQQGALGEILCKTKVQSDAPKKGTQPRNLILKEFTYAEIAPLLGSEKRGEFTYRGKRLTYGMSSPRLLCFKNSPVCVECGKQGVVFRLELPAYGDEDVNVSPHLNLFSADQILMTHDHIIPRSKFEQVKGTKKGVDAQSNLQTMCTHCNGRKGDKLPEGLGSNGKA